MTDRSDAIALADELFDYVKSTDHEYNLWNGDLTHLEQWDDPTAPAKRERVHTLEDIAARAGSIDVVDPGERSVLETVAFRAAASAVDLEWREELRWVNPEIGIIPVIFTFLPRYPLVTTDDGKRYLEKVRRLPVMLDRWCEAIGAGVAAGRAPIRHLVTRSIAVIDRNLSRGLSDGPLGMQPAPTEMRGDGRWPGRLADILDGEVTDALRRVGAVLDEVVLPAARPDDRPGLVHLAGGAELYERLVWANTTLHRSAAEVHDVGLQQVARLADEYREMAGPLLGTEDLAEILERLRSHPDLHYHQASALVADAGAALAKASAVMNDWFGVLPKATCVATSTEQGAQAFYSPPADDGSKPGRFFFNTSTPESWGTFALEAVAYHEGIPGHHLQIAIARESSLHRLLAEGYIPAYSEGWGLYTERLADEMGLYSSDLDRVGMLSADSMRACRLVVDTGMHALGWSRERAIEFMVANSPMTPGQVAAEIDRYIGNPGQALGYMMGRLEIDRIRADAERRLGTDFDIKAFHDVVLGTGAVPLDTLRRTVEEWLG